MTSAEPIEIFPDQFCLPLSWKRRPRRILYAAQSHGPHARCLRFVLRSPLRRKTRFRLCLAAL